MAKQQQATKIINLSGQSWTEGQTELSKLGLAFALTPKFDLNTMENDLLALIHKLGSIYHFTDINENEINPEIKSFSKPKLTETPQFTKNRELKNLIRNVSSISFYNTHKQDNIINLHKDLNDLVL